MSVISRWLTVSLAAVLLIGTGRALAAEEGERALPGWSAGPWTPRAGPPR